MTGMFNTWLGFPHLQSGPNSLELTAKPNMTFNLTAASQDFPRFSSWLIWGSRELRWDIFDGDYTEADWKYPPVIGQDHCMYLFTLILVPLFRALESFTCCFLRHTYLIPDRHRIRHKLERHRQCVLL